MTITEIFKKYGIVTLHEAELLTGIKAKTLTRRIIRGKLAGYKVVDRYVIKISDLISV